VGALHVSLKPSATLPSFRLLKLEVLMTAPETNLSIREMLTESWAYWRAARDNGDVLEEDKWMSAIDHLLDRVNAA
jgi:hypothetical protein